MLLKSANRFPQTFSRFSRRLFHDTQIKVFNSLAKTKVPFVLPSANHVIRWYTCGPTVYDLSHLGHARNYVTNDIIQRILKNYFNYSIDHVMGMTDIDDKIVNKATKESKSPSEIAVHFEADFYDDMKNLGVMLPQRVGRVTEHIPEIIEFIDAIIKNNCGYVSNGSVYFDTSAGVHEKLLPFSPSSDGACYDAQETGYLNEKRSPRDFALWKKSKESEVGWENPWSDAKGRPGWHIECSAIASHHLGETFEVHSGGVDLCFPHHNNEIVQSDARFGYKQDGPQWVSYFLHIGHLHISGRKMSKSLKNFITIKEFLTDHGDTAARDFRVFCLLVPWDGDVELSDDRIQDAQAIVDKFVKFFHRVDEVATMLGAPHKNQGSSFAERLNLRIASLRDKKWTQNEFDLQNQINTTSSQVRQGLMDNFNTELAIKAMLDLAAKSNTYLDKTIFSKTQEPVSFLLLIHVIQFIENMFSCFGVSLLHTQRVGDQEGDEHVVGKKEREVLDLLVEFRNDIKTSLKAKDTSKIWNLVDQLRDDKLPQLGWKLKDTPTGSIVSQIK